MKNLAICFLFILISSCENYDPSSTSEISTIEHFNSNHFVENAKAVVLDFSKTEKEFIKDIEHKLGENLCDKGHFIGQIEIEGKVVQFDAFIPKYCETYPPACNKHFISSYINPDNNMLVRGNKVSHISDVRKFITEAIKKRLTHVNETLVYTLNWTENSSPQKTNELLYEILKASENYKIQNEYFNTLIYLDTNTLIIPPPPPPPPSM